ncbi:MerR family transcriptional regulator [Pelagibacterium halotolerans]|uniref:Transcriptional regulator, MerR family n=1 Tax=Pelagibacterium halotolerans (strain DSM 22347 / JCM 15775 / CGMCC 1.7692 / B2) TaxID=1082931 RepID=G4RFJ1_PELHB|nr:MerR family transcriptional regulator [Pelagibacterium halotolerans]AEQ52993.1 transcriptional regulator, MerR family [Pelagibacterium halotolerans B2]QJR17348.1 MerR family transcriptional regulator [Pelagibacterium halotolerans]SEA97697.1 DNA-binding transcriptional regulator, MerR family [Pelagibacterium halotolerans]
MRVGALARQTGMTRDTIRFYERRGLISSRPSQDPSNSYRDYPDDTVDRLDMIAQARDAGMSIAELEVLVRVMETGDLETFDADRFLAGKIAEIKASIERSKRFVAVLEATRKALSRAVQ